MGTAVARNRLRRRLRALLRTRDMPPGEYVFGTINTTRSANTSSIRRQSTERSFEQLRNEVDQLLAGRVQDHIVTGSRDRDPVEGLAGGFHRRVVLGLAHVIAGRLIRLVRLRVALFGGRILDVEDRFVNYSINQYLCLCYDVHAT